MFYEKHREDFHMSLKRSESEGQRVGIEGVSKGLGSQEQEQEQEKNRIKLLASDLNRTTDETPFTAKNRLHPKILIRVWRQLVAQARPTSRNRLRRNLLGAGLRKRDAKVKATTPSEPNSRPGRKPPGAAPTNSPRCCRRHPGLRVQAKTRFRQAAADLQRTMIVERRETACRCTARRRWGETVGSAGRQPGVVDYDALRAGGR